MQIKHVPLGEPIQDCAQRRPYMPLKGAEVVVQIKVEGAESPVRAVLMGDRRQSHALSRGGFQGTAQDSHYFSP